MGTCQESIDHEREAPREHAAVRSSKAGRWRALVLIAVHVAVALHIAHWMQTGTTVSPVEPSESMEFSKRGIVNAGAIFFALTILSTALLGRWFCGWACHIVALQDFCRWLLIKVGLRPRTMNLGVIATVPWLAFAYMFLAPLAQRWMHGDELGVRAVEATTSTFWATFPGWIMAIATFVACGFAIVWFLGAKGFCTYGCPYGAAFGIADQLAPVRIRVTDACEGCGHCTAVCSSNVRVHQEVRDWGAVVDPGCMKCLDCVSVCPKGALYVGAGMPALFAKPRRELARRKPRAVFERIARVALLAGFVFATLWVLLDFNADFEWKLAGLLGGLSLVVAFVFRGKAARANELGLGEELTVALAFVASVYALRGFEPFGVAEGVPLLCALGLAAITSFVVLLCARLARKSDVALQRIQLRRGGRVTSAGACFVLLVAGWIAFASTGARAQHERRDSIASARSARSVYDRGVASAQRGEIERAIEHFEAALALDASFLAARENLAGMLCASGRFEEGLAHYAVALAVHPTDADTHALAGQANFALQKFPEAEEHFTAALRWRPGHAGALLGMSQVCAARGDGARAREYREAAERAQSAPPSSPRGH